MDNKKDLDEARETCYKACEILKETHDGNDLHPLDLKLLEDAVNGFLKLKGYKEFDYLHQLVTTEQYDKAKRWTKDGTPKE